MPFGPNGGLVAEESEGHPRVFVVLVFEDELCDDRCAGGFEVAVEQEVGLEEVEFLGDVLVWERLKF